MSKLKYNIFALKIFFCQLEINDYFFFWMYAKIWYKNLNKLLAFCKNNIDMIIETNNK